VQQARNRVLIHGEAHVHTVLTEYQVHYNTARPHQGISQRVPDDEPDAPRATMTNLDSERIRRKPAPTGPWDQPWAIPVEGEEEPVRSRPT
jgi:hypothetical protein